MSENVKELQPISPEGIKENQPSTLNLPDVAQKWLEIRDAIHQATARGVGRWLSGPGNPTRILNPFLGLRGPGPGQTYGPGRLRGVGAMGGRLRITENEGSKPMVSLRAIAEKNPLIQKSTVKVADLPPGVTGQIGYPAPLRPQITLAPIVNPYSDPGATAAHELGHGGHGPVGWRAKDQTEEERVIGPQAEGMGEGMVRGLYGALAPPSTYDRIYGDQEHYQRAKALGESLARYIAETGRVPNWKTVQRVIFGRPRAAPEPKPETPVAKEAPKNLRQLSSPGGALRAFGIRPQKIEPPGSEGGSSPADLTRKAFGIRPKPQTAFESWEDMLGGMSF